MSSDPVPSETDSTSPAQIIYGIIAEKVRTDSRDLSHLTHVEELGPLFPDMTPEEIVNYLTELYEIEEYQDILAIISESGAALLYSTRFISPEEAKEKCLAEEVRAKVASKVREDSKAQAHLTPVDSLAELFPDLPGDQVAKYYTSMAEGKEYSDIRTLVGPTGHQYLFSDASMTVQYAALLARADAKDPTILIAETVREESKTYPRPTQVGLFYAPVFQIGEGEIEAAVNKTLAHPACADIQKIVASTGAVYLYSNRYMEPGQAERWVQWEEVERHRNP